LLAVTRLLLPFVVALFAFYVSSGKAENFSAADLEALKSALAKAHGGEWSQAYAALAPIKDPLPGKILRWVDYTRGAGAGRFAEIAGFIKSNPDWPSQKKLLRRAEEAMAGEPDAEIADWFKLFAPLSGLGKTREAEVKLNAGDIEGGTTALRAAWVDGDFAVADEKSFLARHGGAIRPQDSEKRLDRLLWDGQNEAARRMLPLVSADWRALAEERLALAAQAGNAEALLAKVPAALRADPGLRYQVLHWLTKKDLVDPAVQILLDQPGDLVRPEMWWAERETIVRRVLATGNADLAYRLVEQHGLIEGNAYSDAQFLLGYIALKYLKKPDLAFEHFSRVLTRVSTPYAKARAGYWGARAAEADGKAELAAKWYTAGAEHQATFYGQLAAHRLGGDAPPHPIAEPVPSAGQIARFSARELVRAAELLFAVGDADHARVFLLRLTDLSKTPLEFAMLAGLAEGHGRTDLAIAVAKRAAEADLPLTVHGYPVTELPGGGTAEHSLLFAIVRQESAFARGAVSPVGARGLMQLMPATASFIANKMQLPFTPARLTEDGLYNVLLGRAYLETLIDDFGGSYALAIAGYNAGPGRVRQWIRDYGDPRGGDIGMVDWIELIPFTETRNYVQRVLENLQIYREQSGRPSAYSLVSDLAR
jgi:soluble lytic murein transglycosylase